MRKFFLVAVVAIGLSACGHKNYALNPHYSESQMPSALARDTQYCHDYGRGGYVPQLQPMQPSGYWATSQGVMTNPGGGQSYYQQNTWVDNSQAQMIAAGQNMGTAIGVAIGVTKRRAACMDALGWKTQDQVTEADRQAVELNTRRQKVTDEIAGDPLRQETWQALMDGLKGLSLEDANRKAQVWIEQPEVFRAAYMEQREILAAKYRK